jgi:hypothetical protein
MHCNNRNYPDPETELGGPCIQLVEVSGSLCFLVFNEREFGIQIPDRDAEKMKTIRDVVEYVSRAVTESMRQHDKDGG